jgi:hypothetical protein
VGALTNQYMLNQRRKSGASAFVQTQPGDPDWSPSQDPRSQAQFPAAAAERRVFEGKQYAQNRMAEAQKLGYDTSHPDFDPIKETAEKGFGERALTMGESIIGWIDGPRQAMNLLLQDIAGGAADEGLRDPTIGDYFNVFFGGLDDYEGFTRETGLNPQSGSATLDMFGWAEADAWWERGLRGMAHFGLDVAIDPLTYLTFGLSGLGKKVAARTAQKFTDDVVAWTLPKWRDGTLGAAAAALPEGHYLRQISKNLDDTVAQFKDEFGDVLTPNLGVAERKGATHNKLHATLEDVVTHATNDAEIVIEAAIRQKVGKEVMVPVVARDFANVNKAALELLPKFMHGGARIGVPFVAGAGPKNLFDDAGQATLGHLATLQRGIVIPGTQGLGRKLVGDPVRNIAERLGKAAPKSAGGLADILKKANSMSDIDNGILRALRLGEIEPWQYQIARSSLDNIFNLSKRSEIAGRMNKHLSELQTLVEGSEDTVDSAFARVFDTIHKSNPDDEIIRNLSALGLGGDIEPGSLALDHKVREIAADMQDIMSSHLEVLASLDPSIKPALLDGRTPYVLTGQTKQLVYRLADGGGIDPTGSPAKGILAMLFDSVSKGGRLESKVGGAPSVAAMQNDRTTRMAMVTLLNDGVIMADDATMSVMSNRARAVLRGGVVDEAAVAEGRLPLTDLNKMLEPEVRLLAEERGIPIPKDWDGKLFNENPLEVTLGFVEDVQQAIQGWSFINSLKAIGLANEAKAGLDVQEIALELHKRIVREAEQIIAPIGVPTAGTVSAPAGWLDELSDVGVQAGQGERGFAKLSGDAVDLATQDDFVRDIAERGVKEPVVVQVDPDGFMAIKDGNHRASAAAAVDDAMEVPVVYEFTEERIAKSARRKNVKEILVDDMPTPGAHVGLVKCSRSIRGSRRPLTVR